MSSIAILDPLFPDLSQVQLILGYSDAGWKQFYIVCVYNIPLWSFFATGKDESVMNDWQGQQLIVAPT